MCFLKVDAMVGAMFGYAIAAADLNWDGLVLFLVMISILFLLIL